MVPENGRRSSGIVNSKMHCQPETTFLLRIDGGTSSKKRRGSSAIESEQEEESGGDSEAGDSTSSTNSSDGEGRIAEASAPLYDSVDDTSGSEAEFEKTLQDDEQLALVNQDARLNFQGGTSFFRKDAPKKMVAKKRVHDAPPLLASPSAETNPLSENHWEVLPEYLKNWTSLVLEADDIPKPMQPVELVRANKEIYLIQWHVESAIRQFLASKDFVGIHTPKLVAGSGVAGATVVKIDYQGLPTCLAESSQLRRQREICGASQRVFEIEAVFRDSVNPRGLSEFVGLDVEMEIKENYSEYPKKTRQLTFEKGLQMLKIFVCSFSFFPLLLKRWTSEEI
ncbi:uncharacterized protein LOC113361847 isoform X1 [Papaver somniferum]|uniref:uncharacterized protein LOC113361847 isoform X1 n=1 Tax=Papaver somniferum TaxID=3469 RepID=UPI000E6FB4CE|nr:uncharacterized protein LOC113361847 isoform X1 [Papaver somniferum]